jgi:hypothetical protein
MAQTAVTLGQVLRDIWTDQRLVEQFDRQNRMLSRLERVRGVMIGNQAQVPIRAGRAGSFTSVGANGPNQLNPATQQPVNQAVFTLPYSWFQIELDTSALAQGSNAASIVSAKDLEVEGAIENSRHQIQRMVATNGDGIVAALATTASANTLGLVAAANEGATYGAGALARGWLPAGTLTGQYVDIGTTADTDALASGVQVTAVNPSPTAPTITISGAAIAPTGGTHFVYIANPNSTTAPNPEVNGLRQIVGSGAFGGLNPATAGQEWWRGALVDTTTTTFSLDLALGMQSAALQSGADEGGLEVWTSFKQRSRFYALLQSQVQFSGDGDLAAGTVRPRWNGAEVQAFSDILDTDWFQIDTSSLIKVTAGWDTPKWASDIEGSGGQLRWRQGFTSFSDAVVYPIQLGARRRASMSAALALK